MVLDTVALARKVVLAGLVVAGAAGCWSGSPDRTTKAMNTQMDRLERMRDDLARREQRAGVVRSQAPGESRVNLSPNADGRARVDQTGGGPGVVQASDTRPEALPAQKGPAELARPSAAPGLRGEAQVRVVANVGNTPVYDSEVREAVFQRLSELLSLPEGERRAREKQMYAEELRRIVERELILDELFAKVKGKNKGQAGALDDLIEAAGKEADRRMRDFKSRTQVASDAEFRALLQTQGLTVPGLRRQVERGFMMQAYLRELLAPRLNGISLGDIRDYYDEHPDEFRADDSVKWLDLFLNASKFRTRAESRQYAETLLAHARAGTDFMKLVKEYDHGLAGGTGEGTKRGEVRPVEAEAVVFGLKQGEAALVEMETGFHIVKVVERTYAGRRPFDEKTQTEVRKKLQGIVSEREYQRIVETLWRRHQPQILVSEPQ